MTPLNLKKKESDMIRIKPDGSIVFLHEDKITEALMNEGDLTMRRATDIRFDNSEKLWYVHLPGEDTKVIEVGFANRFSALEAEKRVLNHMI